MEVSEGGQVWHQKVVSPQDCTFERQTASRVQREKKKRKMIGRCKMKWFIAVELISKPQTLLCEAVKAARLAA